MQEQLVMDYCSVGKTGYSHKSPSEFSLEKLTPILSQQGRRATYCGHCQAPRERRIWLDRNVKQYLDQKTLLIWMMRTTYDQVIFARFRTHSDEWLKSTEGGAPLPVYGAGMGCVRVIGPKHFIARRLVTSRWITGLSSEEGAFIYLLATSCHHIMDSIGLDYDRIFECIKSEVYPEHEWVIRLFGPK